MTSPVIVHDELKPALSFADLKHLKGRKGTNLALDARLRRGDVEQAFASAAHVFEHTFRTQKCLHLALRAVRIDRGCKGQRRHDLHQLAGTVVSPDARLRDCSGARKTACASRCRSSAEVTAQKSTSSSRHWSRRSHCWRADR